jgi:hypothetical protein
LCAAIFTFCVKHLEVPPQQKAARSELEYSGLGGLFEKRMDRTNDTMKNLKSVEELKGIHEAQLLTYMKLAGIKQGFLINFNVIRLKQGVTKLCSLNLHALHVLHGE